jgi:membrane protein implicated in regulation of membrane protease activity
LIRLLFLIIIAAIVLSLAYFGFKSIPVARKMAIAGGALAAAAAGVLMQTGFAWYMAVLALVAVSLLASLVYMKLLEKENNEKEREAEERKARRDELISTVSAAPPVMEAADEPEAVKERETIRVPEKVIVPEKVKMPELTKEPEVIKEPERIKEMAGAKPFGMQSIQPVGKEDQRGQ